MKHNLIFGMSALVTLTACGSTNFEQRGAASVPRVTTGHLNSVTTIQALALDRSGRPSPTSTAKT